MLGLEARRRALVLFVLVLVGLASGRLVGEVAHLVHVRVHVQQQPVAIIVFMFIIPRNW